MKHCSEFEFLQSPRQYEIFIFSKRGVLNKVSEDNLFRILDNLQKQGTLSNIFLGKVKYISWYVESSLETLEMQLGNWNDVSINLAFTSE